MSVFLADDFDQHEHVSFFCDAESGLKAIVAIHSTAPYGIAGGGCRIWPYASDEEALRDALRLSRAMSYKLALCDMPAGGGKMVVVADPRTDKTEALLRAIGRCVERLGGKYIVAEDVGTNEADMRVVAKETKYVVGQHTDTGPATAYGAYLGLKVAAMRAFGCSDLSGLKIAVQGVGNVGRRLCEHLKRDGAALVVSDVNPEASFFVREHLGATECEPQAIFEQEVDVLAPCALGAVLDDRTIAKLKCRVVAGSANNQLAEERHAEALAKRHILYAPDFIVNAGGVIGASQEGTKLVGGGEPGEPVYDEAIALSQVAKIGAILSRAFERAEEDGVTPHAAAVAMAKEAIAERRGVTPMQSAR